MDRTITINAKDTGYNDGDQREISLAINGEVLEDLINAFRTIMLWITYNPHTIDDCFADEYRLLCTDE